MSKILFIALSLVASISIAAEKKTIAAEKKVTTKINSAPDATATKGIRISLIKPNFKRDAEVSFDNGAAEDQSSGNESVGGSTFGLGVSYVSLPVKRLGWTAGGSYLSVKDDKIAGFGGTVKMLRAEGNMAYAINRYVHGKAGLNMSKSFDGDGYEKLDPGVGFQLGGGVQMTKNIGLDLAYVQMNQSGGVDNVVNSGLNGDVDVRLQGIELAINGTF